jgi:Flp pilus assembly protein TadG
MIRAANRRTGLLASLQRSWADECASQIVEFAVSLPLLVFFVVGIFDFSGAISLKQKLSNAAREGARVAAADPANDLDAAVPASVWDAFWVVDNYLVSEKINDCGLASATPTLTAGTLTWVASKSGSSSGCPGTGITLTINRGWVTTVGNGAKAVHLIQTSVTLTYAYKWQFNNVAGLLGQRFSGPTSFTTTATAFNEN